MRIRKKMMEEITWVNGSDLSAGPWRATYLLKPDLEVLARSMADYGWLQPILVQRGTNRIIDGHLRWEIAGSSKSVKKVVGSEVPVIYQDCSDLDAAFMHVRMNRAKGVSLPKQVSRTVRDIIISKKLDQQTVKKKLAMTNDELEVMVDGTLLRHRNIKDHKYSQAWVPVEAPASEDVSLSIERPPNLDR